MEKHIIYIGLEFIFGPIQKFQKNEKGEEITGVKIVDNDEIIRLLDKQTNKLWCSLFSKNVLSKTGYDFDEKKEKEIAPMLLELINELIKRLNIINDGSFVIEDMITKRLELLIKEQKFAAINS